MDLLQYKARPRLVAENADPNPKFRSPGTLRGQLKFDRLTSRRARRQENPALLSCDLDLLVAQDLDGVAAGEIELDEGNLFIRSQLTGLESDRARIRTAEQ
jgi:hypothetical protein